MMRTRGWSGFATLACVIACTAFLVSPPASQAFAAPDPGIWHAFGGLPEGCDGPITATAFAPNGDLLVGGAFTICGDTPAYAIARWNGSGISALGNVPGMNTINAIAIDGNDVFVGGNGGIARWDGSQWSALGAGINSSTGSYEVNAIAIQGDDVYVGGHFDLAGGATANSIARWNRSSQTWSSLGIIGITLADQLGTVRALTFFQGQLFVGGLFDHAGTVAAPSVAIWNVGGWAAAGGGLPDRTIDAFAVWNGALYAGGALHSTQDPPDPDTGTLTRWDGNAWSELPVVPNAEVFALAPDSAGLYAGGMFTSPSGGIALWNGSAWTTVGGAIATTPPTGGVRTLAVGSALIAGGEFAQVADGQVQAHSIATWNGANWAGLPTSAGNHGLYARVDTVATYGNSTCFEGVDIHPLGNLVCWNGFAWTGLNGDGANTLPAIRHLITSGSDLYAVGNFVIADSCCVAHWDGAAWNAVGSGLNGYGFTMTVDGPTVYVSGYFTQGVGVLEWDGSTWHALGSAFAGPPNALAMYDGKLYATGYFTQAGGVPANRIAAWDGANWSAVAGGLSDGVGTTLAVSRGSLYVGGNFTHADGIEASSLARWNGSQWSAVTTPSGNGVRYFAYPGSVSTLVDSDLGLFVGGLFDSAGGTPANSITRFDGNDFHALGAGSSNGIDGYVSSIAVDGTNIHLGGSFNVAGGLVSSKVARFAMDDTIFDDGFD